MAKTSIKNCIIRYGVGIFCLVIPLLLCSINNYVNINTLPSYQIDIHYPEELLNKNFYNSLYNTEVSISGKISGQSFHGTIPIVGSMLVNQQSFQLTKIIAENMLKNVPDPIKFGLIASYIKIVIVADKEKQRITELPEYFEAVKTTDLNSMEGKNFINSLNNKDQAEGATFYSHTTAISEENIMCDSLSDHPNESLFVHEFSHTIFTIGIGYYDPVRANYNTVPFSPLAPDAYHIDKNVQDEMRALQDAEQTAYLSAINKGIYQPKIYMVLNSDEYFAEGSQAYFNAQGRNDVNVLSQSYLAGIGINYFRHNSMDNQPLAKEEIASFINDTNFGINTYTRLKILDPDLFTLMQKIYGDPRWDFCKEMPLILPDCQRFCIFDPYLGQ